MKGPWWRAAVAAALVLAGCGSGSGPKALHLGCNSFCAQAGTPQGDSDVAPVLIDPSGTLRPLSDASIPIKITCARAYPCRDGALFLGGRFNYNVHSRSIDCAPTDPCLGRSNLVVPARRTATIAVPLTAVGRQLLAAYGRLGVFVGVWLPKVSGGHVVRQNGRVIYDYVSREHLTIDGGQRPAGASAAVVVDPTAVALIGSTLWAAQGDGSIVRLDAGSGRRLGAPLPVAGAPDALLAAGGRLWVQSPGIGPRRAGSALTVIDPGTGRVIRRQSVRAGLSVVAMAYGDGEVWAAVSNGTLTPFAPASGRILGRSVTVVSFLPDAVAFAAGSLWVAGGDSIERVDPRTLRPRGPILHAGNGTYALAAADGAVWVAVGVENTVSRVDANTGRITATVHAGLNPVAVAADAQQVWVAGQDSATVTRLDPATGRLSGAPVAVGLAPTALTLGDGTVFVANGGSASLTRLDAAGAVSRSW